MIRDGQRKKRDQSRGRKPDLGYYAIFVNTEDTERHYFQGIRDSLPNALQRRLVITVKEAKTNNLINGCKKFLAYASQERRGWIVLDRDEVADFDQIIETAKHEEICVAWSNPCFEIWLHAYYGDMPKTNNSDPGVASQQCIKAFASVYKKENKKVYSKSDNKLYTHLKKTGNEQLAIEFASRRYNDSAKDTRMPSQMDSCTRVFELVAEIKEKVRSAKN